MSTITLRNTTDFAAQVTVKKQDQVIVFMPSVGPGQTVIVPTTDTYEVIATTVIDGNTYRSAPITVTGAAGFLAEVIQEYKQGTYVFNVEQVGSTMPNQMQFQSTWRETVTFTIMKDGQRLQDVIVADAFNMSAINLGDNYRFQAIINGVTTDIQVTDNPNATCTAVNDTTLRNVGYFTLQVK